MLWLGNSESRHPLWGKQLLSGYYLETHLIYLFLLMGMRPRIFFEDLSPFLYFFYKKKFEGPHGLQISDSAL